MQDGMQMGEDTATCNPKHIEVATISATRRDSKKGWTPRYCRGEEITNALIYTLSSSF